jgi:hypothetical protein
LKRLRPLSARPPLFADDIVALKEVIRLGVCAMGGNLQTTGHAGATIATLLFQNFGPGTASLHAPLDGGRVPIIYR